MRLASLAFAAIATGFIAPVVTASSTLSSEIAQTPDYALSVRLLPDVHQIEVSGTVTLPPATTDRAALSFTLSALMKDVRVERITPGGAERVDLTSTPDDKLTKWQISFEQPAKRGTPVTLQFAYDGGEGIAFTYSIGPDGSFAGQNSFWYPEFDDVRAKGRVAFVVPPGYTVLSTGAQQSGDADAAAGRFTFVNDVPTRFAFAAGRYTVLRRDAIVPVRVYLLRQRATAGDLVDGVNNVLKVLTREFGPYPYAAFAIAEVPDEPARKAGFSGASMNGFILANSSALDAPFNLAYYGHEIGHQWWANLVTHTGPDGAYMLDEAMAQYGSLRVVEIVKGALAAEEYRRTGYPGYNASQSGYGYLLSTGLDRDQPLGHLPSDSWSHELADSKGFLVWDLLSRTIGREKFRAALHRVTREYAFRSIRWDEFLAIVRQTAGEDLGWFDAQWFERAGAPEWRVAWQQSGAHVSGSVAQTLPFYRARIELAVNGVNGERAIHPIDLDNAEVAFSFPAPFRVLSVVADPHFLVLHWLPELHGGAAARAAGLRGFQLTDAGKFDEAEAELRSALGALPVPDSYGARYWTEYSLAYLYAAKHEWAAARQHLDAALAAPTRDAATLPYVYWRYAIAAKALHDEAALRWAVDAAASADAATGGTGSAPYLARALLTQ